MPSAGRLYTCWATCEADVREAQRLRQRVFFEERSGHALDGGYAQAATHDVDYFDAFCDHLLVKAVDATGCRADEVVGTYRVLSPDAARSAGGYYTDTEFDLQSIDAMRDGVVELGRSCVHRDWRRGGVIMMLWTALGAYMRKRRLDSVIGCCSVSANDDGGAARAIWNKLAANHLVPEHSRACPRIPFDLSHRESMAGDAREEMPALMKGYLRCGARLLGPPAYDAVFNTADFPMLLRLAELSPSYKQHFVGSNS